MLAKMVSAGKTALDLTWGKVSGAEGYDVFTCECNRYNYQLAETVPAGKSRKMRWTGLTTGKSYKAYVRAWKTADGRKQYIGKASPTVHAIPGGSSKAYTNPKSVTVKKAEVTLQPGKTHTIEAAMKGVNASLPVLDHGSALRYFSTNRNVAAADSAGKITAKAAGSCVIYVLADNGIHAAVKVKVSREALEETEAEYNGGIYRLNKAKTAAVFAGPADRDAKKLTIAGTVKIGGKSYRVKEIAAEACQDMPNLQSLVIGKNVEKIGKKAFRGCGKLKTVTIRTGKLTDAGIGENAFGKNAKKMTVKCPASMLKKYRKWLIRKGIPKDAKWETGDGSLSPVS